MGTGQRQGLHEGVCYYSDEPATEIGIGVLTEPSGEQEGEAGRRHRHRAGEAEDPAAQLGLGHEGEGGLQRHHERLEGPAHDEERGDHTDRRMERHCQQRQRHRECERHDEAVLHLHAQPPDCDDTNEGADDRGCHI